MVQLIKYDRKTPIAEREALIERVNSEVFEGVKIQTCNRLEMYWGEGEVDLAHAEHLFRVVSGLESGLVGDSSIQGQVKRAYLESAGSYKLSASLHKLFQSALFVGKRVRTETGIGKGAMSHSQAVYHLLRELQPQLKNTNITILGVHHINDNIIRYLSKNGASAIFVANRTYDKAKVLAEKYGAMAFDFTSLDERLKHTDVLITATSAPHLLVHANRFPVDKPMIVFDLAVPRDVDPEIGKLPEVRLFNIEDVEGRISQNVEQRQSSIELAERIVIEEVANFRMTLQRLQRYSPKKAAGF